jgi:hypothetical protein
MNAIAIRPERHPAATDRAVAASLEQLCGLKLVAKTLILAGEPELRAVATRSMPNIAKSISIIEQALEPASHDRLEQALAVLSVTIAKRASDADTDDLQLTVYAARLRQHPSDAALQVLADWPLTNKFWPTWCELEAELRAASRWRRDALAALRIGVADPSAPVEKDPSIADGLRKLTKRLAVAKTEATRAPKNRAGDRTAALAALRMLAKDDAAA